MFLGEYLLLWRSGEGSDRSIVLGRICGVPAGGGIAKDAVIDLLEYEHRPQEDVDGLFGEFTPRKNPDYRETQRGSVQFMRLRDVGRERILVYNVQTFGSANSLRIAVASLLALTDAAPNHHEMPNVMPDSHRLSEAEASSRNAPGASSSNNVVRRQRLANDRPVVQNGATIEVHWTEDPVGWFRGRVTSSRRENDTWVSRVLYDRCETWSNQHHACHYLDPADPDAVEWRPANDDSSDDSN